MILMILRHNELLIFCVRGHKSISIYQYFDAIWLGSDKLLLGKGLETVLGLLQDGGQDFSTARRFFAVTRAYWDSWIPK